MENLHGEHVIYIEPAKNDEREEEKPQSNGHDMSGVFSKEIVSLLNFYQKADFWKLAEYEGPRIKVGEVLSPVALAYERLRYAVDYKKEHLVRRNAIERILRRQLRGTWEKKPEALAEAIIRELIWARYIKNDFYPVSKVDEIGEIVAKYLKLFNLIPAKINQKKEISFWKDWLTSIASCEIEESLDASLLSIDALSFATESWFEKRYDWTDNVLTEQEKKIQLTIAVHRGLFRSDDARTAYDLLKHFRSDWRNIKAEMLNGDTNELFDIFVTITKSLKNPVQSKLYRYVQKQISAFQILKNVIEDDLENIWMILGDKNELKERIYEICEEKYGEIKNRVTRGIIRSIIYIFVTKIVFAIVIEIPYEYYLHGGLSYFPLISTILIPILFVLLVVFTIKRPGEANTKRIKDKIFDFVYKSEGKEKIKFSLEAPRENRFSYQAFSIAYGILFLITFAGISWLLYKAGFDLVGGLIFFIFLSLVLLFAYRVKFAASELSVTAEKETILGNLFTNVSLPLLDLGVWLSDKFSKLNFLIVFLDFLIEAPLKNIIAVMDEWSTFVKEKREEVVEIPVER